MDLSLAQIASLGAAIAVWQGYDPHPGRLLDEPGIHAHRRADLRDDQGQEAHIPQEAIIGISYAVASAAVILTMSKATGEPSISRTCSSATSCRCSGRRSLACRHLRGSSASFTTCFESAFWRSRSTPKARRAASRCASGTSLFYASFGFVVTRSVAIAGVLLVFCYLIVPSVGAMLSARTRIGPRLTPLAG